MSDTDHTEEAQLNVLVFGATGVAGQGVLRACLGESRIGSIRAVVRSALDRSVDSAGRVDCIQCEDFDDFEPIADCFEGIDAVFYCLGKAVGQVPGGEPAYRRLTFDFALAAANAVASRSPEAVFHFLSGAGTKPQSRMMWARVKGETEVALRAVPLRGVVCWRPAMILADQEPAGLPFSYSLVYRVAPLRWLLSAVPSWSVSSDQLGRAMVATAMDGISEGTFENVAIRRLAARSPQAPIEV